MANKQRILWLDNDEAFVAAFAGRLREIYDITLRSTVSEAEAAVAQAMSQDDKRAFDLVILDVMIPTESPLEDEAYPPDATDDGLRTGLLFYKRMREKLAGTVFMIFTVRIDKDIKRAFQESGLPPGNFVNKREVPHWPDFERKVRELIAARGG